MAISNVWVFAQGADGAPTTATQELLTKAREIGSSVTAFVVGDADGFGPRHSGVEGAHPCAGDE